MAHPVPNVLGDVSDEARAEVDVVHRFSLVAAVRAVQTVVALSLAKLAHTVPVVEWTRADRLHLNLMAAAGAEVPAVFHRPVRLEGLDVPASPAVPGVVLLVHA